MHTQSDLDKLDADIARLQQQASAISKRLANLTELRKHVAGEVNGVRTPQ